MASDPAIKRFASFFRIYGLSLGLVVAALPVGLSQANFIAYYQSLQSALTFLASLVAFLSVAAIFGARRHIAEKVFPVKNSPTAEDRLQRILFEAILPTVFGVTAVICFVLYNSLLDYSVQQVALKSAYVTSNGSGLAKAQSQDPLPNSTSSVDPRSIYESLNDVPKEDAEREVRISGQLYGKAGIEYSVVGTGFVFSNASQAGHETVTRLSREGYLSVLDGTSASQVVDRFFLTFFYVLAFAGAASAFVWLSVVEYLQGELQLKDADLIRPSHSH
jgi:hypothetical protein